MSRRALPQTCPHEVRATFAPGSTLSAARVGVARLGDVWVMMPGDERREVSLSLARMHCLGGHPRPPPVCAEGTDPYFQFFRPKPAHFG